MNKAFVPGFRMLRGTDTEQYLLLRFMQRTYAELYPGNDYQHLRGLIDQYWSLETPFWLVIPQSNSQQIVACLWLGTAIDQITGDAYTHIFMLYVDPDYRKQGLGTALLEMAERWASDKGDQQIGLQVFTNAQPALALYEKLGYQPRALLMIKEVVGE